MKKITFLFTLLSLAGFFALAATNETQTSVLSSETYEITLLANYPEGGEVYGGGSFLEGEVITVSALAHPFFYFINWTEDGEVVWDQPDFPFTVTGDRTLTANFAFQNYNVTVLADPTEGGEVFGSGTYENGTAVTIGAEPNPGYIFEHWRVNEVIVSADQYYTFTLANDITFTAHFIDEGSISYNVTVWAVPYNGGTVSGGGSFAYGEETIISAINEPDYYFLVWKKEGEDGVYSAEPSFPLTVTENATFFAIFFPVDPNFFHITLLTNPPEACPVGGGGYFPLGHIAHVFTSVSCEDDYYNFVNWLEDGVEVSTVPYYYTFVVDRDRTLVANFEIYELTTIPSPPDGGMVSGSGNYPPGIEVTLSAIANDGYEFVSWTKNRSVVSTENPYTFISALNDEELVATFKSILGIETIENSTVKIYPNPTTGELIINNEQLTINNIAIFDVYGRELINYQLSIINFQFKIDISHFSAGIYFLHVNEEIIKVVKK